MGRPRKTLNSQDRQLLEKIVLKVKKLREQRKLSLEEFYNDTSIHLARIEAGKKDVQITTLRKISEYFGLSLSEFFKGF